MNLFPTSITDCLQAPNDADILMSANLPNKLVARDKCPDQVLIRTAYDLKCVSVFPQENSHSDSDIPLATDFEMMIQVAFCRKKRENFVINNHGGGGGTIIYEIFKDGKAI